MKRVLMYIVRVVQIAVTLVLALLLICNLYLIFMEHIVGEESPAIFGYSTAVIVSGSMEPLLSVDDLIFNRAQGSYEEGDIITFHSGSSLTTHRIISVTDDGYMTQGDANNSADLNIVPENAVVGRVVWSIPHVGSALAFLKTPPGMVILIFTGLCIIELPFFFHRWREQNDGEEL